MRSTKITYRAFELTLNEDTLLWSCSASPAIAKQINRASLSLGELSTSAPFELGGVGGVIARDLQARLERIQIVQLSDSHVDTSVVS